MTYRKFNGIQYPVPGVDTAIEVLRPGARWDMSDREFYAWEDEDRLCIIYLCWEI